MINEENTPQNVFGEPIAVCSTAPMTGFYRDGCCQTDEYDHGTHTVCAVMTDEFLQFSKNRGNDLSTPRPEYSFPGLKSGDRWCVCVSRWLEAHQAGLAPMLVLKATHIKTLRYISLEELKPYDSSFSPQLPAF